MNNKNKLRNRLDYLATTFAIVLFSLYWLLIFTYSEFYFINPFLESNPFRVLSLLLTVVGWIAISSFAPLSLLLVGMGKSKAIDALPFAAAIWPISIICSQIVVFLETGSGYWAYLIETPVFLATDFIVPMALVALWLRLRIEHLDEN